MLSSIQTRLFLFVKGLTSWALRLIVQDLLADKMRLLDSHYGLVATSGVVAVRCESEVAPGDYVASNTKGVARKISFDCGYKVVSTYTADSTFYAVISLDITADHIVQLGADIVELDRRVTINESNILSAANVATQAYNKSLESDSVSQEAVRTALEAILKANNSEEASNQANEISSSANTIAAQAKAISESAVISATRIGTEVMDRANDAWAKADEVREEAYSLCAKIDKHSVGEYSQAYGLTLEQAQSILEPGMIYVPTRHSGDGSHTEVYDYTNCATEVESFAAIKRHLMQNMKDQISN
mgnify:CR=1 FL=1